MKFQAHFKLEFDIKTNAENMEEILSTICKVVSDQLKENIKDSTEIEVIPTATRIEVEN
jgi:hypothetical protein